MALAWETDGRRVWWHANISPTARYRIERNCTYTLYTVMIRYTGGGYTSLGSAYTLTEAKQMAQRHHRESR